MSGNQVNYAKAIGDKYEYGYYIVKDGFPVATLLRGVADTLEEALTRNAMEPLCSGKPLQQSSVPPSRYTVPSLHWEPPVSSQSESMTT